MLGNIRVSKSNIYTLSYIIRKTDVVVVNLVKSRATRLLAFPNLHLLLYI
nr:MAG TPA: hypothetical protein [Bacteriophage sp.]